MAGPRLTGLEFHWFGKGQLLATRFQQDGTTNLDQDIAALTASVSEDARGCYAGSESLRRVASRFRLDAEQANESSTPASAMNLVGESRRVRALRRLAADLEEAATAVAAWKQRSALSPEAPVNPA